TDSALKAIDRVLSPAIVVNDPEPLLSTFNSRSLPFCAAISLRPSKLCLRRLAWIPASAGMTEEGSPANQTRHGRAGGHPRQLQQALRRRLRYRAEADDAVLRDAVGIAPHLE